MGNPTIDLVYFEGCPNADEARENLRSVLDDGAWQERDVNSAETPERFRRYGSPTVLVNGHDVTGEGPAGGAAACRAEGAPSAEAIRKALAEDV